MKKLLAVLMAAAMLTSVTACGGDGKKDGNDKTTTKETTTVGAENVEDTPVDGKKIETKFWTLTYDPEVWSVDEEYSVSDDENAEGYLFIPGETEEDDNLFEVEIYASLEDPYDFRDSLVFYGFDEKEYTENKYDLTTVGGVGFLKYENNSWGQQVVFFNRFESAGVSISIYISGDFNDSRVTKLLEGLKITLEDIGNEDGPWYWEGTPFSSDGGTAAVGNGSVKSEWIPFDECVMTKDTFDHGIAVVGDTAYIISDAVLNEYHYDGKKLSFVKNIPLDEDYEYGYIQATDDGCIWLSGFMAPLLCMKDGEVIKSYDDCTDNIAMHPSGKWGVSWFSDPECKILEFAGDSVTSTTVNFGAVSMISELIVGDDYIYVCGSDAADESHKVFLYDKSGELKITLTGDDEYGLGSVTFAAETANGFICYDGNMREILFRGADGSYICDIKDSELFGTEYPWFCGGAVLDDGSYLMILTDERADESAMEVAVFKLTVE
ncbi:MAG: hypothetical protein E7578_06595 [Ruminococcaceae bacterium]|nr:hypothetical protein [Oscillospiraceae bacterium]